MRRKCWFLLCLPASLGVASAADNPFVRPARPMIARHVEIVPTINQAQPPADETATSPSDVPVRELPATGNSATQDRPTLFPPLRETPGRSRPDLNRVAPLDIVPESIESSDDPTPDFDQIEAQRNPLFGPSIYGVDRIAKVTDNRINIPKLIAPTTNISTIGSLNKPEDIGGDALDDIEALPEGYDRNADWSLTSYFWQAPNTFSLPLFFEDVMLERHGHERHPKLTPILAGARFFGTIPMLPYLATINDPKQCYYHLGYYRPGSCAPPLLQRPPYIRKAAIWQGMTTAGAIIAIP